MRGSDASEDGTAVSLPGINSRPLLSHEGFHQRFAFFIPLPIGIIFSVHETSIHECHSST